MFIIAIVFVAIVFVAITVVAASLKAASIAHPVNAAYREDYHANLTK